MQSDLRRKVKLIILKKRSHWIQNFWMLILFLLLLGNILTDTHQLDRVEASYLRALELSPNDAIIHGNVGDIYYDQGRFDLQIQCIP